MTETTITDAIVWPEDEGTGAPVAEDEGDWASAAYHASMALSRGATGYVDSGLSLSYNPSDTTMDIGAGLAFIRYTGGSSVQLTSSSYDEPWDEELVFMVSVPSMSNLQLDSGGVNEIYLAVDPTGGDSARYRYGSSITEPSDPHVKIGEIDTAAETTTELARRPVGEFASVETAELRGGVIGDDDPAITDLTGPNLFINNGGLSAANMRTDLLDDETEIHSNITDINFGSNLDVTDVNGTPTVNATDTNTDTRTDISSEGSTVVSNTTDIDFGPNIDVVDDGDGSVSVDGKGTTLFMSDYAPSGGVVDTEFSNAVADAAPGDRIVFDTNDYELADQTVVDKSITIDQTPDATLAMTNTANNNAHILAQGGGIQNSTTTTSTTSVGARTIDVNDTSIFSAGDYVLLSSIQYSQTANTQIQFAEVESVGSGSITLMSVISKEFASGAYVYTVDLLERPVMQNLSTEGGGNRHLQFRWCKAPVYDGVSISEYLEVSLYALDCWQPRYRDVEATDPEGLLSGEGEPVSLYRCTDAYIESPRVYDCRRGIDFAWGTRNVMVVDPVLHGCVIGGITVHGGSESGAVSIHGGEIVCSTSVTDSAHNGHGISMSASATAFISGTTIYGRANGILCSGETHVSNCWVGVADNVGSDAVAAIHIMASNCQIKNTTVRDPDGVYDQGVWIDATNGSLENIHVDVDMEYGSHNMVYVDGRQNGVKHVDIRGDYKHTSGSGNQGMMIHAHNGNQVHHIDIHARLYFHPEQAIRIYSEATNTAGTIDDVSVHNSHFDCAQAAVFSDGGGTFGFLRVCDCEMVTGSTSLSFNEPIDYLIITNNKVDGSIDSSGAASADKTVTGNIG